MKPRYKAWYGGNCPIGNKTIIKAFLRNGYTNIEISAGSLDWKHRAYLQSTDIIAYTAIEENDNERIP